LCDSLYSEEVVQNFYRHFDQKRKDSMQNLIGYLKHQIGKSHSGDWTTLVEWARINWFVSFYLSLNSYIWLFRSNHIQSISSYIKFILIHTSYSLIWTSSQGLRNNKIFQRAAIQSPLPCDHYFYFNWHKTSSSKGLIT